MAGLTGVLAGLVGFAGPASASFTSQPVPLAWTSDSPVHALTVHGGVVYVGDATTIAALDASTGSAIWTTNTDGDVRAIALSSDGSTVLVGGAFTSVGGTTHRHLAAMTVSTGSVLTAWKAGTTGVVRDLVVSGDKVYVGGQFGKISGVAERGLGAITVSTGKRDATFDAHVDKNVWGLALNGSTLIAGGSFTTVNGIPRASIASFNLGNGGATTSWSPTRLCAGCNSYWDVATDGTNAYVGTSGPGGAFGAFNLTTGRQPWPYVRADGDVQAVTLGPDGLVYIGGHFNRRVGNGGTVRHLLAAVNPTNGSVDLGFAPKLFTTYPGVWALASSSSVLFAGGNFTGVEVNGVNNHVPYLTAFPG
ncbi:MAG: PQQ-binding-like beta-propeller repeat protein [Nocardioidaceae bacterium]